MSCPEALDARMKHYEHLCAAQAMPRLPTLARIDGRAFHSFTRGLARPFDEGFVNLMRQVTLKLVEETEARCGYTQSDEISLGWYFEEPGQEIFFGGKLAKMVSVTASIATYWFNRLAPEHLPAKHCGTPAYFDSRVWCVPTLPEAANYFLWREQDAVRNSIQMAAQAQFSHKQIHKKNTNELQEMLFHKGINWNDYPAKFKRGSVVRRLRELRRYTPEEIEKLPEKHAARANPDLVVERTRIVLDDNFGRMTKVANLAAALLQNANWKSLYYQDEVPS
jgi:tRNA(His) guanylyltransferase